MFLVPISLPPDSCPLLIRYRWDLDAAQARVLRPQATISQRYALFIRVLGALH